jgi:hypothetical protein
MKKATESPTSATGVLTFSGHETFTLRHGWLAKAVDAVQKDGGAFSSEDAMSISEWARTWFAQFGSGHLRQVS